MDAYLFMLWKTCRNGHYSIATLADAIHLSPKQTKRYLNKWQEDGWMNYTSGRGRGNLSELVWLRHVEREYAKRMLERIDRDSIESVTEELSWDWSPAQAGRFMRQLERKFGYTQTTSDALLIPRKRNFLTTHPLEAADIHSAHSSKTSSTVCLRLTSTAISKVNWRITMSGTGRRSVSSYGRTSASMTVRS